MERRETGGARPRRTRLPAVIAGLPAAGIALTGCGASAGGGSADRSTKEGRPATPALPDGGTAHPEGGGQRSPSPAPDRPSTFALDVDIASAIAERPGSAVVRELAESVRRAETLRGPADDPSEPGRTGEGEPRSGDPYS
ncbi:MULTISPECIES: hypothetical protein [unclassified Streptomyces]|uniref:hypothetical protein n=1 Tax=unclassified Streptomyces TaxID=2593676 RepID=UPI0033A72E3C